MPLYIFQNPKTKEYQEIIQRMSEEHVYIDSNGLKWERIFTKPQASMDTKIDATSAQDFTNKTRGKNYSIGQMWDMSAEFSEKRGGTTGKDEVREKAEKKYEERTGKKHPHAKKPSKFFV